MIVWLVSFKATFNNISVISWRSVLLVEETRIPGENHRPVASNWQTLSHNVVHLALIDSLIFVVWWCLTPLSLIFQWRCSFIGGGHQMKRKKNTDLLHVTDKLSHYAIHITLIENRTHNVSGDRHWLDRYKNVVVNSTTLYHTITVTTAPIRIIAL